MYRQVLLFSAALALGCAGATRPTESPLPDSPENIVLSVPGMH